MQDWAEIRRWHRSEGLSKAKIARLLAISWNTVQAAVTSDRLPKYQRAAQGSVVDGFEPQVRGLFAEFRGCRRR